MTISFGISVANDIQGLTQSRRVAEAQEVKWGFEKMFESLIGNETIKAYLKRVVEKGMIGNSLLFAGPEGIGKSLFAEAFAKLVICQNDPDGHHADKIQSGNHPDIRIYRPEGKVGMHSIASMRQLSEEVYLAPYEASRKIFIIQEADRMLSYSANALLKTFEEPSLDTIIILLSSAPASLLPTVLSRCRTVHFQLLSEEEITTFLIQHRQMNLADAANIAMRAQGSIGHAINLMNRLKGEGEDVLRTLLINLLSQSGSLTYKQLSSAALAIASRIEEAKKGIEEEARASLLKGSSEYLTAMQKQGIEKEIEGAVALHSSQETKSLFLMILGWYRDLQMMKMQGNPTFALHRDCLPHYERCLARGQILTLEEVLQAIADAKLALERSTSLSICFENLFLKLNLLRF